MLPPAPQADQEEGVACGCDSAGQRLRTLTLGSTCLFSFSLVGPAVQPES